MFSVLEEEGVGDESESQKLQFWDGSLPIFGSRILYSRR